MANILVTGTNRGIGLEICRQLAARGDRVIAACRHRSPELDALDVQVIDEVDVGDDTSVASLVARSGTGPLDVLIHNAGILLRETPAALCWDDLRRQFEINTLGPLRVIQALKDRLAEGGKVAIVSSRVGSIGDNASGGNYGYRMSKAAVNMAGVNLAHDLRPRGISAILLHPGFVATDMTGGQGIDVSRAATGLIARIDELDLAGSGTFRHANGEVLPW